MSLKKILSSIAGLTLAGAGLQILFLVVAQAYADYGWLGALVVLLFCMPLCFIIVPLIAWLVWPGIESTFLYSLLALLAITILLSQLCAE